MGCNNKEMCLCILASVFQADNNLLKTKDLCHTSANTSGNIHFLICILKTKLVLMFRQGTNWFCVVLFFFALQSLEAHSLRAWNKTQPQSGSVKGRQEALTLVWEVAVDNRNGQYTLKFHG